MLLHRHFEVDKAKKEPDVQHELHAEMPEEKPEEKPVEKSRRGRKKAE